MQQCWPIATDLPAAQARHDWADLRFSESDWPPVSVGTNGVAGVFCECPVGPQTINCQRSTCVI